MLKYKEVGRTQFIGQTRVTKVEIKYIKTFASGDEVEGAKCVKQLPLQVFFSQNRLGT